VLHDGVQKYAQIHFFRTALQQSLDAGQGHFSQGQAIVDFVLERSKVDGSFLLEFQRLQELWVYVALEQIAQHGAVVVHGGVYKHQSRLADLEVVAVEK